MTNPYFEISFWQVAVAALLILCNGAVSVALQLRLERPLLIASARMVVQLVLIGFVLEAVFAWNHWYAVLGLALAMTLIAGVAAVNRADRSYAGAYLNSLVSIWFGSWFVTGVAVGGLFGRLEPWYSPQYLIPLLGMILGNSLTGISLGLNGLAQQLITRRDEIEMRLACGATRWEASQDCVREAVRTGMIPVINSMMVMGIVSLPGMMTGQLLAGIAPVEAIKYQIVIMFLIAGSTALGTVSVVLLSVMRLFDREHRLRAERLRQPEELPSNRRREGAR